MDTEEIGREAREHAWQWFSLHAAQRMQAFNFFLVAIAFLAAAYANLLDKSPEVAVVVALLAAWIAFWFQRLDARSRQLVEAGEQALIRCQAQLADRASIPALNLVTSVENPVAGASRYTLVIKVIQWTVFAVFLAGAAYAAIVYWQSFQGEHEGGESANLQTELLNRRLPCFPVAIGRIHTRLRGLGAPVHSLDLDAGEKLAPRIGYRSKFFPAGRESPVALIGS
jgi:hypothetical protein